MNNSNRIEILDAIRGFAIISIMLLHNIEHFDVYYFEQDLPESIKNIDKIIWDSLFFLFGGKVYAIFALLFGVTYHIQSSNQKKKGNSFNLRFSWRLILLFGFGIINSAFFEGDILSLYAVVGFIMIPSSYLNNKQLLILIFILFAQPLFLTQIVLAIQEPIKDIPDPVSWSYFHKMFEYIGSDSFIKTIIGNLTNGKKAVILWNWENGRYFQMAALFLCGMILARNNRFENNTENTSFWKKSLLFATLLFVPLFWISSQTSNWIEYENISRPLVTLLQSWSNLSFMFILVSLFYLTFRTSLGYKTLNKLSPIGKMSLSNYVLQSIVGSFIYYGFGLGLYRYTGATYGLIIGIVLSILSWWFCKWWMSKHRHGPLEGIWHKLTWIDR